MCLAIPVKVETLLADDQAIVDIGGVKKQISVLLIDDLKIGDYVIMHVGYALNKIDAAQAEQTLAMFSAQGILAQELTKHQGESSIGQGPGS